MKRKFNRVSRIMATSALAMSMLATPVLADEPETPSEVVQTISISDRGFVADESKGVIDIQYKCDDVLISGATVRVTKIATVDTDLGRYRWIDALTEKYGDEENSLRVLTKEDVILEGFTANELNKMAKEFAGLDFARGEEKSTDKDGQVSFDVDAGLYLIEQTGKTDVAAKYYDFDPYILSVPVLDEDGEPVIHKKTEDGVVYITKTLPKTTTESIPTETPAPTPSVPVTPPPDKPGQPVAGLEFNNSALGTFLIVISGIALVVSMSGIGLLAYSKTKRGNDENEEQ